MTATEAHILKFELAERNALGLQNWQLRRGLCRPCIDAVSPLFREHLNNWFMVRRREALAWMARPLFHRRQAG